MMSKKYLKNQGFENNFNNSFMYAFQTSLVSTRTDTSLWPTRWTRPSPNWLVTKTITVVRPSTEKFKFRERNRLARLYQLPRIESRGLQKIFQTKTHKKKKKKEKKDLLYIIYMLMLSLTCELIDRGQNLTFVR